MKSAVSEGLLKWKISPYTILAGQMIIGAIIFTIIGLNNQLKTDLAVIAHSRFLVWLMIGVIFTFVFGNLLIFLGIQAKNATLTGIIELCYPVFTILFTWLLFREHHVNISVVFGGVLIVAGVAIISIFN